MFTRVLNLCWLLVHTVTHCGLDSRQLSGDSHSSGTQYENRSNMNINGRVKIKKNMHMIRDHNIIIYNF